MFVISGNCQDAFSGTPRWALAVLLGVASWFLTTHLLHVFSEVINWDEFALLDRADRTLRFGKVLGGGRPGLVPIALIPFVRDCIDSVRSVVNARLLWQLVTLLYLAGVYFLVRRWFAHVGRPNDGRIQGLLAVALLAFLPSFVTWSVQVRTDQAALAAAVWGGVLLLSTSYRQATLAGILFGVALLCTQKGIYIIGLCGLLFATSSAAKIWPISPATRPEVIQMLGRATIAAVMIAATLGTYALLVPEATHLASSGAVTSGLETMRWTRESQGYRIYSVHADRLVVHWVLFTVLVFWSCRAILRRDATDAISLITCWLTVLLGIAVIVFHGSSFPYFLMTAGLFPALALSLAVRSPLALASRMAWPILVTLIALAALQSAAESIEMLADTQWEQRETMRLVYDSNLRNRRGYQVEGALFCARDPDPLPALFSQDIWRKFKSSPQAARATTDFISQFRARPVAYIVESYRLRQFPQEIRDFFSEHYVWYARSLYVAGFHVDLPPGGQWEVDVIVPGEYRWVPDFNDNKVIILVGNDALPPTAIISLNEGKHTVSGHQSGTSGRLILADLPPADREGYPAFYHRRQIAQLGGYR